MEVRLDPAHEHMVRTYEKLRIGIAIVTMMFLFTLFFYRVSVHRDDRPEQNSISAYYYHDNADWRMRDWFIASLCGVGVMLIIYRGYSDGENRALMVAGAALIGVAAFPMDPPDKPSPVYSVTEVTHYTCAVFFFGGLAYVCWTQAEKTLVNTARGMPRRHRFFTKLYRAIAGLMILLPLSSFALYFLDARSYVYWAEYTGVVVFLAYWIAKTVELRLPPPPSPLVPMPPPPPPPPPANRAQWVVANCATVVALVAIFGVYSFYAAAERERIRAAQEALARIYPMDSEVKRIQSTNKDLRPLLRNDPTGDRWEHSVDKDAIRNDLCSACSYYGNLFEYYLLIQDTMLAHAQGKDIIKAWDAYLEDICKNSYAFRGYIKQNETVWSKAFRDKFKEYAKDLPYPKDVHVAPPPVKK